MARNGAAESDRCSSGQRGPADGGIGCAPAVSLRVVSVCWATLPGDAHRRSQEQEQEDAGAAAGKKRESCAASGWPAAGNVLFPLHSRGKDGPRPQRVANVPGVEGCPWHYRPQRGRWAVNPLIRVLDGDP